MDHLNLMALQTLPGETTFEPEHVTPLDLSWKCLAASFSVYLSAALDCTLEWMVVFQGFRLQGSQGQAKT